MYSLLNCNFLIAINELQNAISERIIDRFTVCHSKNAQIMTAALSRASDMTVSHVQIAQAGKSFHLATPCP